MTTPRESDRRLRHNFRLARLLRFLELVSGRGNWNPRSLMQELEVSERTIHRLRETLELAGVPLYFSHEENAYRVRPDFRFPPLHLTEDEALALGTATALSESESLYLPSGSSAASRKTGEGSNDSIRKILDDVTRFTQILDLKIANDSRQHEKIKTVQWALVRKRMLSGRYSSPYEPAPVTIKLHPYRLALIKNAWYLIGASDKDKPKTFRIVRFQTLKILDREAQVPDDFDLKAYFGNAWAVYRGDRRYEVELRFTSAAADTILETTWHHSQEAKRHPNGEVSLRFSVDGLNEIVRWVLGWADRVRVEKPEELRLLVIDHHRRAIELNSG